MQYHGDGEDEIIVGIVMNTEDFHGWDILSDDIELL